MSEPLRLAMLATGEFALPTFRKLFDTRHEIVGLVTQPDRTGRGHHRHRNLLKELAEENGVAVFQPANINEFESVQILKSWQPDLFVVAAYGQILRPQVIETPMHGAINLHASILPKYRGAAPIQYAIWNGETETGVSIFQIEPKLDAGPVLGIETTPIGSNETSGELHDRLAELAAPFTEKILEQIADGTTIPVNQPQDGVTKAPRIRKEQGLIDWSQSVEQIRNHVRAMTPWPSAFTFLHQQDAKSPLRLTIHAISADFGFEMGDIGAKPGNFVGVSNEKILVITGDGVASIERLQPAGKKVMEADEFLRGRSVQPGDVFGPETLRT